MELADESFSKVLVETKWNQAANLTKILPQSLDHFFRCSKWTTCRPKYPWNNGSGQWLWRKTEDRVLCSNIEKIYANDQQHSLLSSSQEKAKEGDAKRKNLWDERQTASVTFHTQQKEDKKTKWRQSQNQFRWTQALTPPVCKPLEPNGCHRKLPWAEFNREQMDYSERIFSSKEEKNVRVGGIVLFQKNV